MNNVSYCGASECGSVGRRQLKLCLIACNGVMKTEWWKIIPFLYHVLGKRVRETNPYCALLGLTLLMKRNHCRAGWIHTQSSGITSWTSFFLWSSHLLLSSKWLSKRFPITVIYAYAHIVSPCISGPPQPPRCHCCSVVWWLLQIRKVLVVCITF
jgi:hypothetical protein